MPGGPNHALRKGSGSESAGESISSLPLWKLLLLLQESNPVR